ncbi:hypothetical protein ACDQ55_17310 [Chitinophaga sp. 30R24]|uniref:hypothetical protein n=1 Tax=Chitinophaga sp. 30R24 TaxID=3248838 RepID=UPI003B8FAEFA
MEEKLINKDNGYLQVVLVDDCDFQLFYELADYAERELNFTFTKVDDIDSLYYSFKYDAIGFILSYHVYFGIKLEFVDKRNNSQQCEDIMRRLANILLKALKT